VSAGLFKGRATMGARVVAVQLPPRVGASQVEVLACVQEFAIRTVLGMACSCRRSLIDLPVIM
jgi:hypothetical protein